MLGRYIPIEKRSTRHPLKVKAGVQIPLGILEVAEPVTSPRSVKGYSDGADFFHSGVGEFGRPRWPHKPQIVGSNPTTATMAVGLGPTLGCKLGAVRLC